MVFFKFGIVKLDGRARADALNRSYTGELCNGGFPIAHRVRLSRMYDRDKHGLHRSNTAIYRRGVHRFGANIIGTIEKAVAFANEAHQRSDPREMIHERQ
jgi:hypothetical protein